MAVDRAKSSLASLLVEVDAVEGVDENGGQAFVVEEEVARHADAREVEPEPVTELDAEVEAEQRQGDSVEKEALQVIRESRSVNQPEQSREERPSALVQRRRGPEPVTQVVDAGDQDRDRNEELDPARRDPPTEQDSGWSLRFPWAAVSARTASVSTEAGRSRCSPRCE